MMLLFEKLNEMANFCQSRRTEGLSLDIIETFVGNDSNLVEAINKAYENYLQMREEFEFLMMQPEEDQIKVIQKDYVHFYSDIAINPYIPSAAKGPWIITTCGAVIHDSGGYGMLGFGHSPTHALTAINRPHVMANIMTANFAQKKLTVALKEEIGHTRFGHYRHPYQQFLCLNSGSEAITMATRFSDIHAKKQIGIQGKHEGKRIKFLAIRGCFHGRTDRPAQLSHSCMKVYKENLASFQDRDNLVTVEPNNAQCLQKAFEEATDNGVYFEAMFLEPVMGEGNPGVQVTTEFYSLARKLCTEQGTLLVVDSIQAGLRAYGCLSIVDYPGFQELDPPDMEAYSKALNAGQFPLSVLAVNKKVAEHYVKGLYGNTMTTNPRALEVGLSVLEQVTPSLRENIKEKGKTFLTELSLLKLEFPEIVDRVQGTGLLFSVAIRKDKIEVLGENGLEYKLRLKGIGVIHGGENSLRFTPHFWISSEEINLIVSVLREELKVHTLSSKTSLEKNRRKNESMLEQGEINTQEETNHNVPLDEIDEDMQQKKMNDPKDNNNAFLLDFADARASVEEKNPDATIGEKLISYKFKDLSKDERVEWEAGAADDIYRYNMVGMSESKSVE